MTAVAYKALVKNASEWWWVMIVMMSDDNDDRDDDSMVVMVMMVSVPFKEIGFPVLWIASILSHSLSSGTKK